MEERIIADKKAKLEALEKASINPFPYSFEHTHSSERIRKEFLNASEVPSHDEVNVAGRIMLNRPMGKIAFLHLQDSKGRIQVYFSSEYTQNYELLKLLDIGDIIGVHGPVFRTKRGEITVKAKSLTVLAKSLKPMPEKYHGLQDTELRYRKRYLDLIYNEGSKKTFLARTALVAEIRKFLDEQGFIEVDTPILQKVYGGANAKPFITHHNTLDSDLYLRISDELFLKRLIVGGMERVYEICRNFRNEGIDTTHNPEFSMVEWYEAYADYNTMMKEAEELIARICKKINGSHVIKFGNKHIKVKPPFRRLRMTDAVKQYAGIDVENMDDREAIEECKKRRIQLHTESWGNAVQALFDELVEKKLIDPVFIYDYPWETSPLTKIHRKDKRFVERFELYINTWEIANAYSELTDPRDQRRRFEAQAEDRKHGDEETHPMDEEFIEAMEYGMPPIGGIGIGIDRLAMLMTDNESIRDVVLFPILRPQE